MSLINFVEREDFRLLQIFTGARFNVRLVGLDEGSSHLTRIYLSEPLENAGAVVQTLNDAVGKEGDSPFMVWDDSKVAIRKGAARMIKRKLLANETGIAIVAR